MNFLSYIPWKLLTICILILFFMAAGLVMLWVTKFDLPDLQTFEQRRVVQSTKIYDRTGEIVLFDVFSDIRRTVVPFENISPNMKNAIMAIEDVDFYKHNGVKPKAIARAIWKNLRDGDLFGGQGGSTITQQVIKNSLLTSEKKLSRKIKEWLLAPRLEQVLSKDEILEIYLNEIPFGGTLYGVQEASRHFFGKDAHDLTIVESAYLSALPQAPTYYSPYGSNREALEHRKNFVLKQMLKHDMVNESEFQEALNAEITFLRQENFNIKAPHFVMYIREQLEEKYGKEVVEEGGLKVITTLDYKLQQQAEEIVKRYALENEKQFNAENAALVATDPRTGQIITMVGSRDYFDQEIDGNVNIITSHRQPGSTFKPIVYAEAFNKGYWPETILFDVPTQFSDSCNEQTGENCYQPGNYDDTFRGPMTLRNALAQSVNVPAVKTLYLAGMDNSLNLAKKMGLETLTNAKQYGLTLVLGGGEVRPLDITQAYGVFANNGIKKDLTGVLRIEDRHGNVVEEFKPKQEQILSKQTALLVSDTLSDNIARTPAFGANSHLHFANRDVAAKTGTTNDYRDAWIIGYTPSVVVSAWAGNNDNRSMEKKVAGFIIAPMWREFMDTILEVAPVEQFEEPQSPPKDIKPRLNGIWLSPDGIHSILHQVNKNNPNGPKPTNPGLDPQYTLWENGIRGWLGNEKLLDTQQLPLFDFVPGLEGDLSDLDLSTPDNTALQILSPDNGGVYVRNLKQYVVVTLPGKTISNGEVFINGNLVGDIDPENGSLEFIPEKVTGIKKETNSLFIEVTDSDGNTHSASLKFGTR